MYPPKKASPHSSVIQSEQEYSWDQGAGPELQEQKVQKLQELRIAPQEKKLQSSGSLLVLLLNIFSLHTASLIVARPKGTIASVVSCGRSV